MALRLGLIDSRIGLILIYTSMNLSLVIWLLRGFFIEIPIEIEEAALVDGYTRLQIFWRIAVPLVRPGIVTAAILSAVFSWNEFLFASVLTQTNAADAASLSLWLLQRDGYGMGTVYGCGRHCRLADRNRDILVAKAACAGPDLRCSAINMPNITFAAISKTYADGTSAVRDLDLSIGNREFLCILGPSGCGKSSTLRMLAGLETISAGDLLVDGKRINDMPARSRDMAMVFENYALYPHLDVFHNMAMPLDCASRQ